MSLESDSRTRDYDPTIGKWTTPDPLLFSGGDTNLYLYSSSDPVNLIDPSGLSDRDVRNITNLVNSIVTQMNQSGMRYPGNGTINGEVNNFLLSLGTLTNNLAGNSNYMGCYGQANAVAGPLSALPTDDNWTFTRTAVEFGTHYVLTGYSSNPNDPVLTIDPWRNRVSKGK